MFMFSRFLLLLLVVVAGCAPHNAPTGPGTSVAATGDPVTLFKPILARLQTERTAIAVSSTDQGKWFKRQMAASSIKYDIHKTDSLVSPFEASVSFTALSWIGPECPTQEAAAASELPSQPFVPTTGVIDNWAKYLFQDGKWIIYDCGWKAHSTVLDLESSHSDNSLGSTSIDEWWAFFGGR
jgi:hypothetical protein